MSPSPPPHTRDQVTPTALAIHLPTLHSSLLLLTMGVNNRRESWLLPTLSFFYIISNVNTHLLTLVTLASCSTDLIAGCGWCILKVWAGVAASALWWCLFCFFIEPNMATEKISCRVAPQMRWDASVKDKHIFLWHGVGNQMEFIWFCGAIAAI